MKEFNGKATTTVPAPIERSFALVYSVEDYPRLDPDLFREVEVLERGEDGGPTRARAKVRVARGRFVKEFELLVAVRAEWPKAVYIERIPHEPADEERLQLTWTLAGGTRTEITLTFAAALSSLPSFLPLGGAGDQIARSMVQGVRRALGG